MSLTRPTGPARRSPLEIFGCPDDLSPSAAAVTLTAVPNGATNPG
jgi:hypothetical protein